MALQKHSLRNIFPGRRGGIESGLLSGQTYAQKVLSYGPIAYWPLWEAAGPTAECLVNSPAQDGTYNGATLGQTGIGDGNTCPLFDGINDYVGIHSATLSNAFDGDEGTMLIWAKVFNVGVWTDSTVRNAFTLGGGGNDIHYINRDNVNNVLWWRHKSNNIANYAEEVGVSTTDWMCLALTYSVLADEVKGYRDGFQRGVTQNGLGVYGAVPKLIIWYSNIGANNPGPAALWYGWLAHAMCFDRPLNGVELLDLATV